MINLEHSFDFNCPNCSVDKCIGIEIIESPTVLTKNQICDCAIIKECPKCFKKFWHHICKEAFLINPKNYNVLNHQEIKDKYKK